MKKLLVLTLLSLILASCAPASSVIYPIKTGQIPDTGVKPAPADTASPSTGLPNFEHIVLVMLENRDYASVIGNPQMPQINALATNNVLLSNYYAVTHPSLPNYLALMSGSTQGLTSDCTDCFVNQPNLADEIEASGRTWKAYEENMPSPCFLGNQGDYAQKHNPLLYFDSIRLDATRCDRSIVPLTSLDSDLASNSLPNFALIAPNLCNSGHSCSDSVADQWAGDLIARLQASPALSANSLIVLAFDEGSDKSTQGCCGLTLPAGGKVAVILVSPSALPDVTDNTPYSHYSLLKTILLAWNLPLLGQTTQASTQAITAPWVGLTGQPAAPNPPSPANPTPGSVTPANSTPASTATPSIQTPVVPVSGIPAGFKSHVCATSAPSSADYSVKVCFSDPSNGSSLNGDAFVTVTASITGTNPGVQRIQFRLGGAYLLTSFASPYTFSLPTEKWMDGKYVLTASAVLRDGYTSDAAGIEVQFSNGNASTPANSGTFTPATGSLPSAGRSFLVAATGDGAGGEPSSGKVINLIKTVNPNLFLYLGDVYESGSIAEFQNWYGSGSSFFSSLRTITDPTIGNHEYTNGVLGAGYFDYWNNIPNYYSFNAGGWHFISLNSNGAYVDVNPKSDQFTWLQQDLAANAPACTIVFYHHPIFNIGAEKPNLAMLSIWALLAQYHVSIVLNGHDHDYQRWVPLDGTGMPSPNGITEFVAGGGGHGIQTFTKTDRRVAYSNDTNPAAFGVLILDLSQTQAGFDYFSTEGLDLDSGVIPCKSNSTP